MSTKTTATHIKALIVGMGIGTLVTFMAYELLTPSGNKIETTATTEQKKPLYWVAPMDANYRRDKPGKSPMGMDLVPVYDDKGTGPDEGAGTIRISSDVINNIGVTTAEVRYGTLQSTINTVGYVAFNEEKLVHIHPRIQGWIEKLYVNAVGDTVKKHQALYDIYSPELVNAQEELLLALSRNNSQLIKAAENRLLALQIPQSAIVTLKKTKQVQQTITFYSPQNGVIETLNIREGFFVKPGTTLLSIGDLSEVWLETEVFERQVGQVKKGMPVSMTLDYLPGKSWHGQVDYIYPTLDAKTRTVKVRSRFSNEDSQFKPNMFANMTIYAESKEQTLLIPKSALIRTGKQDRVVLALGEGRFKSIAVTVGRFDSNSAEILQGLNEGEKIVSSAQFLLDSESSKTSDFERMHSSNIAFSADIETQAEKQVSTATVTGIINSLMIDHGMINISRSAIEKWNRPAATIDFITAQGVSLADFRAGMKVKFTFEIRQGNFIITEIIAMHNDLQPSADSSDENMAIEHENH